MRKPTITFLTLFFLVFSSMALAQQPVSEQEPLQVNGVFPHLSVLGPHGGRSESGIGALLPWADKLWMIGYVAHIQGSRIGLYEISEDMSIRKHPESVTGTFANRYSHRPLNVAFIGPHRIDSLGNVSTYPELAKQRLTATMAHPTTPNDKVLFLTMEGLLYEASVHDDMEVKFLFDLVEELELPETAQPHFKGGFTGNGRVIVANNSYDEREYLGEHQAGRLAEWDGQSDSWTIIDKNPYIEVGGKISGYGGRSVYGNPIFATGWDKKSVILKNFNDRTNRWHTYRLPKGSHSFDHTWNTEWMRIREAQTERFIMDVHGIFYELPMMTYGGDVWGIKPISYHLRIVPDFCFWRGMFVMAGDQTDHGVGQPQSNLLFQNVDDLWNYGKPQGWGGVWREEDVAANSTSDPFLMTGFDKKIVHLSHDSEEAVSFTLEVDFLGDGTFKPYHTIEVPAGGYEFHVFPEAFSAHWIRVRNDKDSRNTTVYFVYN